MNTREQRKYWRKWDAFMRSREAMWGPQINRAIRVQYNQFLKAYKAGDAPVVAAYHITNTPLLKVIERLYINVGTSWANLNRLSLKVQLKERRPIGFNEEITALILQYFQTDLLSDVQNMTNTTKKDILDAIEAAINNGMGFDDIVKMLSDANVTKMRARLIARTEINTASNTAAQLQAGATGANLDKIWIDAKDNRERRDHILVGGTQIAFNEPFNVGGYEMQHPGDRGENGNRTPAKNICNCRCTIAYIRIK